MMDARTKKILAQVHPDLARVIVRAALESNFTVTEGIRTLERQKQLLAAGATTTLNSRHLTGHAVDLAVKVGNEIRWDWPLYEKLATVVLAAAKAEGIAIEWGGHWKKFPDGPHYQLDWKVYPK